MSAHSSVTSDEDGHGTPKRARTAADMDAPFSLAPGTSAADAVAGLNATRPAAEAVQWLVILDAAQALVEVDRIAKVLEKNKKAGPDHFVHMFVVKTTGRDAFSGLVVDAKRGENAAFMMCATIRLLLAPSAVYIADDPDGSPAPPEVGVSFTMKALAEALRKSRTPSQMVMYRRFRCQKVEVALTPVVGSSLPTTGEYSMSDEVIEHTYGQAVSILADIQVKVEDLHDIFQASGAALAAEDCSIELDSVVVDGRIVMYMMYFTVESTAGLMRKPFCIRPADPLAIGGKMDQPSLAARAKLDNALALRAETPEDVASRAEEIREAEAAVKALLLQKLDRLLEGEECKLDEGASLAECEVAVIAAEARRREATLKALDAEHAGAHMTLVDMVRLMGGNYMEADSAPLHVSGKPAIRNVYSVKVSVALLGALVSALKSGELLTFHVPKRSTDPVLLSLDFWDGTSCATIAIAPKLETGDLL